MEEKNCKSSDKDRIARTYKEPLQFNKPKTLLKMDKGLEQTIFQMSYTISQKVHENMINMISNSGNKKVKPK